MRTFLLCLLFSALPTSAQAVITQLEMHPGIPASAEYLAGQADRPAVLLLHGFLQTRAFSTVGALARGMHDAGYAVLSPTLSLGIPGRNKSLACEAVHAHSLDDDVTGIARWAHRKAGTPGSGQAADTGHRAPFVLQELSFDTAGTAVVRALGSAAHPGGTEAVASPHAADHG